MNTQAFTAPHRKRIKRLARQLRLWRESNQSHYWVKRAEHRLQFAMGDAIDELTRDRAREARHAERHRQIEYLIETM